MHRHPEIPAEFLELFVLGKLDPEKWQDVAAGLEKSPEAMPVGSINSVDTFVELLNELTPLPPDPPDVRRLIEKAQSLSIQQLSSPRRSESHPTSNKFGPASTVDADEHQPVDRDELEDPIVLPQFFGKYRIGSEIGRGGMGRVYQAIDNHLDRHVAVKTLSGKFAANITARKRFLREARTVAKIEHENIIPILDVDEQDGTPYLVMPLLRGGTLRQRMQSQSPPGIAESCLIVLQTLKGLRAAHRLSVVHRDLKPSNIWIEMDPDETTGRVRILDFGLARCIDDDAGLTNTNVILGTPAYMSPEQARAEAATPRSDLFSVGCILYELLTGHRAFSGKDSYSILTALAVDTPQKPERWNPRIPPQLSAFVLRLLAKEAVERPGSADEAIRDLERIIPTLEAASGGAAESPSDRSAPHEKSGIATGPYVPVPQVPSQSPLLFRKGVIGFSVGVVLLVLILLFGTTVIRVITNTGELVLEIDDANIEVVVKQDKAEVTDRSKNRTFVLKAGEGEVEFYDPETGAKATTREFKIVRGKSVALRVTAAELARAKPVPAESAGEPMSALALVPRPATIRGLASWSLETIGHRGQIEALAYHKDGRYLACLGDDGAVRIWDIQNGKLDRIFLGLQPQRVPRSAVKCTLVWSPDGKKLAGLLPDGSGLLWDGSTGKILRKLNEAEYLRSFTFTPEGRLWGIGYFTPNDRTAGNAAIWDLESGQNVRQLPRFSNYLDVTQWIEWSKDTKWVYIKNPYCTLLIPTTAQEKVINIGGDEVGYGAFHPESQTFLYAHKDGLQQSTLSSPLNRVTRYPLKESVVDLSYSPDGRNLLLVDGNSFHILDMTQPNAGPLRPVAQFDAYRHATAWSPDSKHLAIGASSSSISMLKIVSIPDLSETMFAGHRGMRSISPTNRGGTDCISADKRYLAQW